MSHVIVSENSAVLELRLNRPEKRNALTGAMYETLAREIGRANGSDGIRVIVISAEGDVFSAGNDIADFLTMASDFANAPPAAFINALVANTKVMIAAVNGPAIGVGATLLLHCDLVYATAEATFSTPFVKLGLVPEAGATLLMPLAMGYRRAARLLLLGETFSAGEASAAGLISGIVDRNQLRSHVLEQASKLARSAPQAVAATRALMRAALPNLNDHMLAELKAFANALQSAEAREALMAFAGKREPIFANAMGR